ncbi:hypothetical protein SDC9_185141 [bioreactor metagenome]|uniref:Uncharacterized protein n=1 Tax=bioreactor metagenome TaxID=1076179 RepID=A0A645HF35_9ZZZZ
MVDNGSFGGIVVDVVVFFIGKKSGRTYILWKRRVIDGGKMHYFLSGTDSVVDTFGGIEQSAVQIENNRSVFFHK